MTKVTIKKTIILIVSCFTVFVSTAAAFAATTTTTPDVTTTATPTVATEPAATSSSSATSVPATTSSVTTEPVTTTTNGSISIAPDSLLYPLKLMVESVQTTLTFTPEGKAELLVSFANKRLAEANLMTEKNKQKLVLSVMKAYVKTINAANEKAQEAASTQPTEDVKSILDSIQIIEQSADNFVIKVTGTVPQNISDQLKTVIADQVKKTIVNEAVATTQDKVKEANQQVNIAKRQLEIARKSGNEALIKSATDALAALQKSKDDALTLKSQVKAYKKDVVNSIKQKEASAGIIDQHKENRDENDRSDKHYNKSEKDKHKDKKKYNKYKHGLENRDEYSYEDNHEKEDKEDEDD